MKTKIFFVFLSAVLLGLLVVWSFRPASPEHPASVIEELATEAQSTATPQNSGGKKDKSELEEAALPPLRGTSSVNRDLQKQIDELAHSRGVSQNVLTQQALAQLTNMMQEMQQTVNRTVEFYAKVVDENGLPLAGASIEFGCIGFPEQFFQTNGLTDLNGVFVLNNATGATLTVFVSKAGYEQIEGTNQNRFDYSIPGPGNFHPDPNAPVVFYLRRKSNGD